MPYHRMSPVEIHALLASDPPRTGKLATVRPDGRPHVVPVWYLVEDGGTIIFTTGHDSVKGRNLRAAGRAALCVDDEDPPYAWVLVEGRVDLIDDPQPRRAAAGRIGARYMGEAMAEHLGEINGGPDTLLVRLHPDRVSSAADLTA